LDEVLLEERCYYPEYMYPPHPHVEEEEEEEEENESVLEL